MVAVLHGPFSADTVKVSFQVKLICSLQSELIYSIKPLAWTTVLAKSTELRKPDLIQRRRVALADKFLGQMALADARTFGILLMADFIFIPSTTRTISSLVAGYAGNSFYESGRYLAPLRIGQD